MDRFTILLKPTFNEPARSCHYADRKAFAQKSYTEGCGRNCVDLVKFNLTRLRSLQHISKAMFVFATVALQARFLRYFALQSAFPCPLWDTPSDMRAEGKRCRAKLKKCRPSVRPIELG